MTSPQEFTTECCIPGDHPSLAGHFPGNPVVPGVVILDAVLDAAKQWRNTDTLSAIPSCKFLNTLRAEEAFSIQLSEGRNRNINFRCTSGETLLASGQLVLA